MQVKELRRKHGFSEPSNYAWKGKFGGMNVLDAQRLKTLEAENNKLKDLLVKKMLAQGMRQTDIAAHFKVSRSAVT